MIIALDCHENGYNAQKYTEKIGDELIKIAIKYIDFLRDLS